MGKAKYDRAECSRIILERLTDGQQGRSLRQVCAEDDCLPTDGRFLQWVAEDEALAKQYARARTIRVMQMEAEILEIADDGRNDTYTDDDGNERTDHDVIQRSKLRVDTRKFFLTKIMPKVYGDVSRLEHTGKDGGPIETIDVERAPVDLDDWLSRVHARVSERRSLNGSESSNGHG